MDINFFLDPHKKILVDSLPVETDYSLDLSFDKSLDKGEELLGIFKKSLKFPSEYRRLQETLNMTDYELIMSLPQELRNNLIKGYISDIQTILGDKENQVYVLSYLEIKAFLDCLQMPLWDNNKLEKIKKEVHYEHILNAINELTTSSIKTIYSMTGTATGRLTVADGPNILTLPAIVRKAIKPKVGGKILQIDLTSAEPSLALRIADKELPDDIYRYIAYNILEGSVDRQIAKQVTLSSLYGQSPRNLERNLPTGISGFDVVRRTKEYFKIEQLRNQLKKDADRNDLRNLLGRPLEVRNNDELFVNHYLQSSIAEYSLILFSSFCHSFKNKVIPYYVIHDALIFEANNELADKLLESREIFLGSGKWTFKAKVSFLNE